MPLSAILWDLDGTLVHFKIDYKRARMETIRILEKYGYPQGLLNQNYYVLGMLKEATDFFIREKIHTIEKITQIRNEINKKVAKIEREASYHAESIDGIRKILEFCVEENIKSCIITLNTTQNAILSLESANLIEFFPDKSLIIGRDVVEKIKPNPEHAIVLLEKLKVPAEEVCVIGDHPSDIELACSINARSIGFTSEKHPASEFKTSYLVELPKIEKKLIELLKEFIMN
ncbi:MAG: HAD family hydrolase [Promethearchaeota archaeon]